MTIDDDSRHCDGAIARIKLCNFLTYTDAEFFPGPQLNMVIGPNGTGKSTIVCAVALGLAGRTDVLGRAKEVREFIKHGADAATVEIELKNSRPGESNLIVERSLTRSGNSSKWKLRGQPSTEKQVKEAVKDLNVQVDNLCQFLPQDRVSAFALMDSKELLKETERAVGGEELLEKHSRLTKDRVEEKKLQQSIDNDKTQMENLQSRNAAIEREVTRFLERDAILQQVKVLEMTLPWIQYDKAVADYQASKASRNAAKATFQELQQHERPLRDALKKLKDEAAKMDGQSGALRKAYSNKTMELSDCVKELEELENEFHAKRAELDSLRKNAEVRARKLEAARQEVVRKEEAIQALTDSLIADGVIGPDGQIQNSQSGKMAHLSKGIDEMAARLIEINSSVNEVHTRMSDVRFDVQQLQTKNSRVTDELRKLDDSRNRKMQFFNSGYDRDVYNGIQWLAENRGRFRQRVFDPIAMEINITDKKMADIVESSIGIAILGTFVTTCKEDYDLLCAELYDREKLRVNVHNMEHPLSHFRPSMTRDEIQQLGFESFLLDSIQGPEEILAFLCQRSNVHRIPVTTRELRDHDRIQGMRDINSYVSNGISYSVRRAYGGSSTRAMRINPARLLGQSVDLNHKRRLEEEFENIQRQLEVREGLLNEIRTEEAGFKEEDQSLRNLRHDLIEERKLLVQRKRTLDRAKQELIALNVTFNTLRQSNTSIEDERQTILLAVKSVALKRAKRVLVFHRIQIEAANIFTKRTELILADMRVRYELEKKAEEIRGSDERLKAAEDNLLSEHERVKRFKGCARDRLEAAQAKCEDMTEEEKLLIDKYKLLPQSEIDEMLAENNAKADMIMQTNPGVVDTFNERKAEIDTIKERLAREEARIDKLKSTMTKLRTSWENELNDFIVKIDESFSAAFESMGCAGEVRIGRHEDYDQWGVEIFVKFRESEKLELLTGHRQSGGERSVSTMLYLISLQGLSKSPFRVVDEINQGMDPRNERMVHKQIVEAACGRHTSQYFLVTPKLLPDLEYHEDMRILCVMNGVWQPDEGINVQAYLPSAIPAH